jgi:hypothetical protein
MLESHPLQSAAIGAMSPLLQFSLSAISSGTASLASTNIGARASSLCVRARVELTPGPGDGWLFTISAAAIAVFWLAFGAVYRHVRRQEQPLAVPLPATPLVPLAPPAPEQTLPHGQDDAAAPSV